LLPPEKVKKCLSRMSWKLSRTVLRRGKGSNPFSLVEYCSSDFRDLLTSNNIQQSMSRKGNPYDNASAENFFSCLKCECTNFYYFRNREEAKLTIFEYIEVYYNRQRRHAALGWITPATYKKILLDVAA
jgi:transposase InsO family protein